MNNEPIIIEQTYNAPASKIWQALTDKQQMKQWYFDVSDFKPEVGFQFQFNGGPEDRVYVHLCTVTEVFPNQKLKHSWRYQGYEGTTFVTWELFEESNQTKVRLTHEGIETFPADNVDFARENFVQGWTYITGTQLKNFVEEKTT
jgi:uncharacterized protein YndB with AHSA1/START domain